LIEEEKMYHSRLISGLLIVFAVLMASAQGNAIVITESSVHMNNFVTSPDGGTLILDDWYMDTTAYAFDTLSGSNFDYDDDPDWDGEASASASTSNAFANASASYNTMELDSNAKLEILDTVTAQADAYGISNMYGSFMIDGGAGSVDVTFSFDYDVSLYGSADNLGYFENTAYVGLMISDDTNNYFLDFFDTISGTNTTISNNYSGTLSNIFALEYNVSYDITLTTDPEPYGTNVPEPTTILLVGTGLTGFILARRRKRKTLIP